MKKGKLRKRQQKFKDGRRFRISKLQRARNKIQKLVRLAHTIQSLEDSIVDAEKFWDKSTKNPARWRYARDRVLRLKGALKDARQGESKIKTWLHRNRRKLIWWDEEKGKKVSVYDDPIVKAALGKLEVGMPRAYSPGHKCKHKYPTGTRCPFQVHSRDAGLCEHHQRWHDAKKKKDERRKEAKSNAKWEARDWKHKTEKHMKRGQ